MDALLSTQQAAKALGVSRPRVLQLITAGRLPATKVGRDWVIAQPDLAKVQNRKPGRPRKAAPRSEAKPTAALAPARKDRATTGSATLAPAARKRRFVGQVVRVGP